MAEWIKKICILFLVLCGQAIVAQEWVPPIGIPDPGFGISELRPARPSPWITAIPGYYYVNQETGTDSGNSYGTPANPRRTIPGPIPGGSYVEVHGNYTQGWGGWIHIAGNGSAEPWQANVSGPIWVVGENEANRPIFSGLETAIYGSFIYLDTIAFRNNATIGIYSQNGNPTHHVMVRRCEVEGLGTVRQNGVVMEGVSETTTVSQVIVCDSFLHRFGDMEQIEDQDASPMLIGRWCNSIWVVDNRMETATGSFRSGGAYDWELPEWTHHIYIGRNTLTNIQEVALWVKMGSDIIMSQNHVYETANRADIFRRRGEPVPPGYAWDYSIGIGAQYKPNRLWIIYNHIHTVSYGIRIASFEPGNWSVFAIGNVIHTVHHPQGKTYNGSSTWSEAGIHLHAGGEGCQVVNNTIFDADAGINISGQGQMYGIANNIISHITESTGNHLNVEHAINHTPLTHTLFHQVGGAVRIRWYNTIYNLNGFQSATGNGQHCLEANPLFISSNQPDLHLQSASPARDLGTDHPVYQTFQSLYGLDIRRDADGRMRPQGSAWDMGAYEYATNEPNLAITSPNGSEVWRRGEQQQISWTANGISDSLIIEILQNESVLGTVATGIDASSGSYSWTVGRLQNGSFVTGANLKIRISTASGMVLSERRIGSRQ